MKAPSPAPDSVFSIRATAWRAELFLWVLTGLAFSAWLVWGPAHMMTGVDYELTHHYYKYYLKEAVWNARLPEWNPYTLLGRPFLADPEVAAFYPPTWLFILLPETLAYWLFAAFHFTLTGFSVSLLIQSWGGLRSHAIVGSLVWLVCPAFLGRMQGGLIGFTASLSWWPLLLLYTDRLCERRSLRTVLIISLLLAACFFAGHTHVFWLCCCALGFYILPRCCEGSPKEAFARSWKTYLNFAAGAFLALGLCSVQLLPLLELAGESNRSNDPSFASFASLSWDCIQSLLRYTSTSDTTFWEGNLYLGIPVAALGIASLCALRDVRMRALAFVSLMALGLALGKHTPLFNIIYPFMPGMGSLRFNMRFGLFALFSVIVGFSMLWPTHLSKGHVRIPIITTLIIGALALWLRAELFDIKLLLISIAMILSTLCGLWLMVRGRTFVGASLLIITLLGDYIPTLCHIASEFSSVTAPGENSLPSEYQPIAANITQQQGAPARLFVSSKVMKANSGMQTGYSMVSGNVALSSARVWNYLHYLAAVKPSPYQVTYLDHSIFNVSRLPYPGMNIAMRLKDWNGPLILNSNTGTRAWLCPRSITFGSWMDVTMHVMRNGAEDGTCLVETKPAVVPEGQALTHPNSAVITSFSPEKIEITTKCESATFLVLAEAWFPGWHAEVNGTSARVFPANVWMRAIELPAGNHQVRFSYKSAPLRLGAVLSLIAAVILTLLWRKYPEAEKA